MRRIFAQSPLPAPHRHHSFHPLPPRVSQHTFQTSPGSLPFSLLPLPHTHAHTHALSPPASRCCSGSDAELWRACFFCRKSFHLLEYGCFKAGRRCSQLFPAPHSHSSRALFLHHPPPFIIIIIFCCIHAHSAPLTLSASKSRDVFCCCCCCCVNLFFVRVRKSREDRTRGAIFTI